MNGKISQNHFAANRNNVVRFLSVVLCALMLAATSLRAADDQKTPEGTIITNRAEATYDDGGGASYSIVSETVSVRVVAVPAVAVTPDETAPSAAVAANERVTRAFRVCNTGNVADAYSLLRAEITQPAAIIEFYYDLDDSGTLTAGDQRAQLKDTVSPRTEPNNCFNVLTVIETNNIAADSALTIKLTALARTGLPNGDLPSDEGTIINTIGAGARFTAPLSTDLPPIKLVENLPRTGSATGQILNYSIAFRNSGGVTARNVRLVDELPVELEYIAGTLQLDARSLTDAADADEGVVAGRRITVTMGEVAPEQVINVRFQAKLNGTATDGAGVINRAVVSAENAGAVDSTDAVAVVNPFGIVYAGSSSAGAAVISNAQVTIATDERGTPLTLFAGSGFAPNVENKNSFATDARGAFSFLLTANQLGETNNPARYFVNVTAANYRARLIEVLITPTGNNLFQMAVRALDGQPIAVANGFALTGDTVTLQNLAAPVFNIPLFELSALEITKTADKQAAEIGEIITYRVSVRNATASVMRSITVRDELPASFVYAEGTARIETGSGQNAIEPERRGNTLLFNLDELKAGENATISYRVRVGANASEGEKLNTAVASGVQPSGERITTQPARAAVRIRGGVFSMQQTVVGRVYEDRNRNGKYDNTERPVVGARVYLNNGQSVITDSAGQYNVPATSDGALVLSLDPLTLPAGYLLADDAGKRSSKSWTRLLRTPLGGGSLLRQNFALVPAAPDLTVPENVPVLKGEYAGLIPGNTSADSATSETAVAENQTTVVPVANVAERRAGTFTEETKEDVAPVAPGDVQILTPQTDEVIMSLALNVKARVAEGWKVRAEVNAEKIADTSVGETRVDNRNRVITYSLIGLGLRPGKNAVRLTAVGANGEAGKTVEINVWGRGAATRLELRAEKGAVQTGGRETVAVRVRAFDQWGHPAADGQVAVETSAGRLVGAAPQSSIQVADNAGKNGNPFGITTGESLSDTVPGALVNTAATAQARQQTVQLVNGEAVVQLAGDASADSAELRAVSGTHEVRTRISFTNELRAPILVGLAEATFGNSAPEIAGRGDAGNYRGRLAFYFRGRLFNTSNLLTLAYDSHKSINRTAGRDRLFELDPLERAYPLFGDSSVRFEDAMSNSKLYAKLERGRSYAMFGDMDTDQSDLSLAGYSRRLTGVKLHLENERGDFISLTGARPDTAYARDIIPGGSLGSVFLTNREILQGSETVTLERRDRRNPEIILEREQLLRSIDYNLNPTTGEIFFLRPVSTFDQNFNLIQTVVTYEYRGADSSYQVYTGRGSHRFDALGLRVGASYVHQTQGELGAFGLGGIDLEKRLPNNGKLTFEAAMSRGRFASNAGVLDLAANSFTGDAAIPINTDLAAPRNGMAFRATLDQPINFFTSRLRAEFNRSSPEFFNPFGATVAAGAQRLNVNFEMRPTSSRLISFGFTDERNRTQNVDNSRLTFSAAWSQQWRENLRTIVGFDHRRFADNTADTSTDSNLLTVGVEYKPIDRLELTVKREQNLGDAADPTYPDQTVIGANYAVNQSTRLFFSQRLASGAITPISDITGTGFASTSGRRETSIGVESKLNRFMALNGRYQLENGINGTDSFAVVGLQNRLPINKFFAVEAGYERGLHLAGNGKGFNNFTFGGAWTPDEAFRATARYELRDRDGLAQLLSVGAAGRIGSDFTTMARAQFTNSSLTGGDNSSTNVTAALAYRPLRSDRYALLLSYNHRGLTQTGAEVNGVRAAAINDRLDTLSADGLYQANKNLELYGRFALRFNQNGDQTVAQASSLTYLAQARAQQRISDYFDVAGEARWLMQPASGSSRQSFGTELGFWALPDLRLGVGYNFTRANEINGILTNSDRNFRSGYYFTITSKLSNLFDLFGTSKKGLVNKDNSSGSTTTNKAQVSDSSVSPASKEDK